MEKSYIEDRLKAILPTGKTLQRGHLAEIMASDPVLRLVPYYCVLDKAVENGVLQEVDTPDGPALKTVAQAEKGKG